VNDAVIGDILVGKYRVERILGQGGMGRVVEATHLHLDQRVAIKFVLPEALQNPEVRARFVREAMAAAKLKSAHVARVLDIGTLETGSPFIVMELLQGDDLASILRRQGPLPISTAAAWILEACEALAEAHAIGIVHRDIKPSNLFLAAGAGGLRSIKVFDFGISKMSTGNLDASLTRTVSVLGSPGYASPEQLRSTKNVDLRTDIWALGVTLYQLVSGDMPWVADTLPELSIKIAIDPAPTFSPHLRIPPAFERVIRRCLEKDPALRFPSVAALAEALGEFAPNGRAAVERVMHAGMVEGANSSITTGQASAGEMASTGAGGSSRTVGVIAGLVVAAGIVAALVVTRGTGDTKVAALDAGGGHAVLTPPAASPDAPAKQAVVAPPDAPAKQAVVAPPDAPPKQAVVAPPDAGRGGGEVKPVVEGGGERYRELVAEAKRLGVRNCATASRLYESAIDVNPRGYEALAGLGTCLLEHRDYDRAISNFLGALSISRRYPEALIGIAEAYQYKGNSSAAVSYYKQYLDIAPRGDRAALARENLAKITGEGGKQTDDDLFGAGGNKPR